MDALIYILAVFGFILLLAWLKVPLTLSILGGTFLMDNSAAAGLRKH